LTHGFRGFTPWLVGSVAFRPVVRQHIMVKAYVREPLTSSQSEGKEKQRKGSDPNILFKGKPPMVRTPMN
jgi:hypothetical protein